MSVAAYPFRVYWKATNAAVTSADLIYGVNDTSFAPKMDQLDTTQFLAAGAGVKTRIYGLADIDLSISADLNMVDPVQVLLRADCDGRTAGFLNVIFDPTQASGSQGWQVQCNVESYTVKGSVSSKAETEFKLTPIAAKVAI